MAISSVGFAASAFTFIDSPGTSSGRLDSVGDDEVHNPQSLGDKKPVSGDISDYLSTSAKRLLKRLSELQTELREIRGKMQIAENAAYSDPQARASIIASFQSQLTALTSTTLLLSSSLMQELDRSGGISATA